MHNYIQRKKSEERLFKEKVRNIEILIKTRFEMINTYLSQIKYDEKFTTFIHDDKIDYYNLTKLQQELRKNSTLIVNVGYTIGIKKDNTDILVNFVNTSPSKLYYEDLDIPMRADLLNEKLRNLTAYDTYFLTTSKKIIYFYRDYDVNMVRKFTWIIAIDKEQFFHSIPTYENFNFYIENSDEKVLIKGQGPLDKVKKRVSQNKEIFGNAYVFVQGEESIKIKILRMLTYYIFPLLILNIFIYMFSKSISVLLYNPIKDLKKNLDISEKDSIELIEYTYAKLKDQNEFLEKKSQNIDVIYKEKQIKDYLLGISNKKPELLNRDKYNLILIEICEDSKYEENYSKEYILTLKTKIEMIMTQKFEARLLDIDYNHICFIYEKVYEKEYVESVLQGTVKEFNIKFKGAILENIDIVKLNKAYKTLLKLLDYKNVLTGNLLISLDEVEAVKDTGYYYTFEVERKLIKKIGIGNLASIYELLDDIFEENLLNRKINADNLVELEAQMINTLKRVAKQQDKEINIEKLVMVRDINEFALVYKTIVKELCEESEVFQDKESIKIAIEKYIEEHYMEDISLDIMSEYIGFSAKYLSTLFKQLLGKNFKVALDEKRIEKAKEIMYNNSEVKVKDIAEKVGFNSANTFIRVFKKYEGVSPGNFSKGNMG